MFFHIDLFPNWLHIIAQVDEPDVITVVARAEIELAKPCRNVAAKVKAIILSHDEKSCTLLTEPPRPTKHFCQLMMKIVPTLLSTEIGLGQLN